MRYPLILRQHTIALALPLALLLTSCGAGTPRVAFIKPVAARTERVPAPAIPEARTPCAFDATKLCLTDEQTAGVIGAYDAALAAANEKLAWLEDFFNGLGRSATK